MRVIEIEAMDEDAVEHRSISGWQRQREPDDGVRATIRDGLHRGRTALGELVAGRGEADTDRIGDTELGVLRDMRRHVGERHPSRVAREFSRY